jgi:putative membrane protein
MKKRIAILFLVIIYAVGFVGIGLGLMPDLVYGTPVNLLISLVVVLFFDTHKAKSLLWFGLLVFILGYGIEVIGIQTGKIFGTYSYGDILGFKLWNTPLMIGINWLLLVITAGNLVDQIFSKNSQYLKIVIAATLMLFLDYLIEPVAIHWTMWVWENIEVPLQNYIAWWLIAAVMFTIYYYFLGKQVNKVASAVFIIQVGFFALLNLVI